MHHLAPIWSAPLVDRLRTLVAEGLSAGGIAAALNATYHTAFTRNAVIGKMGRLGLRSQNKDGKRTNASPVGTRSHHSKRKPPIKRGSIYQYPNSPRVFVDHPVTTPALDARPCSLLELDNDTCRWPHGNVGNPDFHFCGAPANLTLGKPYCPVHTRSATRL
jgi:GcrA cell cycle regulator